MASSEDQLMQALHDEHAAALWSYCVRLTGTDRARAQDVCQETLLRAWQHPEVLSRPPATIRRWLFTVARNIVIDEWRSRRAHRETVTADPPDQLPEHEEADQLLQSWVVAEAVSRLSTDHRRVLYECYFQGRSVADAARRLELPEGTVKSRTHYALRALRLALEEMGVTS
ncbi:MAG TPA: sigma-70 family RNA polymerase sigma factor [Nocardioidaceae bacterium]|nr:sigma-70 family RNA polymerase sigma factor [Nocardioidaceae bacterium]